MRKSDLAGKVQTALGTIAPEELGITLAHEHCLIDKHSMLVENPKPMLAFV